jgi:mono/diheme cytochrome c family protein
MTCFSCANRGTSEECRACTMTRLDGRMHRLRILVTWMFVVAIGLSLNPVGVYAQMQSRQALLSWVQGKDLGARPKEPKPPFDANLRLLGEAWYGELCIACHGPHGDGNGPRAGQLSPRPRDFTKGVYEFRSTPTGALPTDEDIWKVVSDGLHGTAMVPWISFAEYDRWALVSYVESFSPRFASDAREVSINVTAAPDETPQLIAQGHNLFGDAGCIDCHGVMGLGDGPSAANLADASGRPIRPLDFSSGVFRRGASIDDIFLTVRTGLDGTPMPSYAESLTDHQTWAIAAYVRSLIAKPGREEGAQPSATVAEAQRQERMGMMIDMPGMGRIPMCRDVRARSR